jgi:SOS response regulatory protein OraA/RecX
LTEAQLWSRLVKKAFGDDEVRQAVAWCKAEGYVDDALFARLYVEGARKRVGDARFVAELVRRGIDRATAAHAVAQAERTEDDRLAGALEGFFRARPAGTYAGAARRLERLGFPASAIYRHLRAHASRFVPLGAEGEDSPSASE